MCKLSVDERNKLGNAVVYIAANTHALSKTKLLKLLFLMEEYAVKKYHTPFLGLSYEVWQAGPVVKDVFIDLSEQPVLLKDFVTTETENNATYITPLTVFCDDEFSDDDIDVMEAILKRFGDKTATELVNYTHRPGSAWYKVVSKENLLEAFQSGLMNSSPFTIDFSEELSGCAVEYYKEQLDFLLTTRGYRA